MNCANGGNNKFLNFPAFMADGRNFAEWMPQAVVNNNIRKREGILTNWQYRKFLQSNSSRDTDA